VTATYKEFDIINVICTISWTARGPFSLTDRSARTFTEFIGLSTIQIYRAKFIYNHIAMCNLAISDAEIVKTINMECAYV